MFLSAHTWQIWFLFGNKYDCFSFHIWWDLDLSRSRYIQRPQAHFCSWFSSMIFRAYILGFTCKGPKIWYIWSAPKTSCRHFRPYSSVIIIWNHAKVVNCHEDKCFKLTWRTYWNGQQICIISVFSPVYKPISLFCVNLSRKYIYLHLHFFELSKAQVSLVGPHTSYSRFPKTDFFTIHFLKSIFWTQIWPWPCLVI